MLDAIFKARQLGSLALERAADYLDLVRIETELQFLNARARVFAFTLMVLGALFALVFICAAVVITFWDTPYRVAAAWGVAAVFVLVGCIGYFMARMNPHPGSAFKDLHDELQKDLNLIKEIL